MIYPTGFDSNDLIKSLVHELGIPEYQSEFLKTIEIQLRDTDRIKRSTTIYYLSNIIENYEEFFPELEDAILEQKLLKDLIECIVDNLHDDLDHDMYLINTFQRCTYSFSEEFKHIPVLGLILIAQKYLKRIEYPLDDEDPVNLYYSIKDFFNKLVSPEDFTLNDNDRSALKRALYGVSHKHGRNT